MDSRIFKVAMPELYTTAHILKAVPPIKKHDQK